MNVSVALFFVVVAGSIASAILSLSAYVLEMLPACVHLTYSTCN